MRLHVEHAFFAVIKCDGQRKISARQDCGDSWRHVVGSLQYGFYFSGSSCTGCLPLMTRSQFASKSSWCSSAHATVSLRCFGGSDPSRVAGRPAKPADAAHDHAQRLWPAGCGHRRRACGRRGLSAGGGVVGRGAMAAENEGALSEAEVLNCRTGKRQAEVCPPMACIDGWDHPVVFGACCR